jgi:hypothetical protein
MEYPDDKTDAAAREIAALLASAYRRHHRIQRLAATSHPAQLVDPMELASSPRQSVHVHEVDA